MYHVRRPSRSIAGQESELPCVSCDFCFAQDEASQRSTLPFAYSTIVYMITVFVFLQMGSTFSFACLDCTGDLGLRFLARLFLVRGPVPYIVYRLHQQQKQSGSISENLGSVPSARYYLEQYYSIIV